MIQSQFLSETTDLDSKLFKATYLKSPFRLTELDLYNTGRLKFSVAIARKYLR